MRLLKSFPYGFIVQILLKIGSNKFGPSLLLPTVFPHHINFYPLSFLFTHVNPPSPTMLFLQFPSILINNFHSFSSMLSEFIQYIHFHKSYPIPYALLSMFTHLKPRKCVWSQGRAQSKWGSYGKIWETDGKAEIWERTDKDEPGGKNQLGQKTQGGIFSAYDVQRCGVMVQSWAKGWPFFLVLKIMELSKMWCNNDFKI